MKRREVFVGIFLIVFLLLNYSQEKGKKGSLEGEYEKWRSEFAEEILTYIETEEEYQKRLEIFSQNLLFIKQHNENPFNSYRVKINQFADISKEEFQKKLLTGINNKEMREITRETIEISPNNLPKSFDWRSLNLITPIKNQQSCNACWAFAATGAIETLHAVRSGNLSSLSEQNLIDCSFLQGNKGCYSGTIDGAFEYVKKNKGIDTEESYPYTASGSMNCYYNKTNRGALINSFVDIPIDEGQMEVVVGMISPVAACIDASDPGFQFYSSGIFYSPFCSKWNLNHALLIVGYNSSAPFYYSSLYDNSTLSDYWIAKNSWGKFWGKEGYIWIARNMNNTCGIVSRSSYPS